MLRLGAVVRELGFGVSHIWRDEKQPQVLRPSHRMTEKMEYGICDRTSIVPGAYVEFRTTQGDQSMSSEPYPNPQAIFNQQYEMVRRDEVVGILLALFLGTFGIHHFYLRRTGLGILYLLFCWTGITWILGVIECFFMPAQVPEFNAIQAAGIAASLGIAMPGWAWPGQCNCEYAACGTAGDAAGMRAMRANESAGVAVLFGLRRDAIRRDTGRPYLSGFRIVGHPGLMCKRAR
jgi:TM2 domain-containing membrane protein YozV